ncbi:MAG TPA: hypothetical protein PKB15_04535 [Acidimicrobiia bacterium]|nr:hypothetical protein [Acidimicrobiia bacterium]
MTQPTYSSSSPDISPIAAKPKRKAGLRFTSGHLLMVVSGLLAFLLSLVVLTSREATITVFVAKNDIVAGKTISANQFTPVEVKSSSLNSVYVNTLQLQSNKKFFAARSISKGEPLTQGALTPETEKTDVRLLSIPVDKSLAVAGALSRGDRIDIIQTPEGECSIRVLSNLEIVVTPSGSGGGALSTGSNAFTLTVALENAGDDLTLAGVIAAGKFQIVKTTGTTSSDSVDTDPFCENGSLTDPLGG